MTAKIASTVSAPSQGRSSRSAGIAVITSAKVTWKNAGIIGRRPCTLRLA